MTALPLGNRDLTPGDLEALIQEIPAHVDDAKAKHIELWPVRTNRASELGHPCSRYLVYNRVAWRHKRLHDVGLQYIFDEGHRGEQHALTDLREAGYTLVEGQRPFDWPEKEISGHIDGKILLPKGDPAGRAVPLEIKSLNPYDWERLERVEDLRESPKVHLQKIPAQLTLYLLMSATEEVGALALRNKSTGRIKTIAVPLDYAYGETLLAKAERVTEASRAIFKAGGIPETAIVPEAVEALLPARVEFSEDVCGRCPFFHLCLPDKQALETAVLDDDPDLRTLLDRRAELAPLSTEYWKVDKAVKERIGARPRVAVGPWLITTHERQRKGYTVEPSSYREVKIERLAPAGNGGASNA